VQPDIEPHAITRYLLMGDTLEEGRHLMPPFGLMDKVTAFGLIVSLLLSLVSASAVPVRADTLIDAPNLVEFAKTTTAPQFALPRLNGGSLRLESLRGHFVVINFWATWCPPCVEEMPSLGQLYDRFRSRGLEVVAIASDAQGESKVASFAKTMDLAFPILLDSDQAVSRRWGASNLPLTFVIDPQGRVIAAAIGERDWSSDSMTAWFEALLANHREARPSSGGAREDGRILQPELGHDTSLNGASTLVGIVDARCTYPEQGFPGDRRAPEPTPELACRGSARLCERRLGVVGLEIVSTEAKCLNGGKSRRRPGHGIV
jgi:peroxiredoxin